MINTAQPPTENDEPRKSSIENEDLFKILVDGVKDYAIFMLDPDGIIISWNEGAHRLKGYTEKEIVGKHFSVLYPAEDRENNKPFLALEKAKEKGTYEEEGWRAAKNGNLFLAHVLITAVYRKDGTLRGFAKVTHDLTEVKKSQEEKKLLNDELEKVFNYSVDLICTIDGDGRFKHLSKASETILGYKPHELVGREFRELLLEKDVERSEKTLESILSGIPVTNFENHFYRKNGTIVPLIWSAYWSDVEKKMFCVARDATEQKRLENNLKNEKDRFTELFLQAPVCIRILRGKNHVFEMANPLYLETFGREDILGKTVRKVFPEAEGQGYFELLDQVFKTGEFFVGEEMLIEIDKTGTGKLTCIYLNFVYQPYKNAAGEVEGIFFFGIDVTEQVQSRKKIEESEKRYRDLIQNLPVPVYLCDVNGQIILYNKAAVALWGREPVAGKDFWTGAWKTYKKDGTIVPPDQTPIALTLRKASPVTFPGGTIIERPDGHKNHVLCHPMPTFDYTGELTGALNVSIDITAQKQAEKKLQISNERFEIVIKATNDAIWDWNLESGHFYWNKSYERLFGYAKNAKEQTIDDWLQKIHPDDRDRVKNSVLDKINNVSTNHWHDEYRYFKANGDIATVINRGFIMFDENQKPVRFVGAMQDITNRKKTEIEKEYLINHLTQSNRDLQQFNYITSHNLRGPLSNLLGLLNLVDYNSLNNVNKDILNMFKSSTRQLDQTINDLNQILVIKDNQNLKKTRININEVFKNVCKYFVVDIETQSVTINTQFECKEVTFNKSYFESILSNLLSNALKYCSEERPLEINISTERKDDGKVLLTFSDNGMGIDMSRNKEHIFGLYQKFHSNTKGKGLGLFITKAQVTSLGGNIEVESEVDKGTTFYITFNDNNK